jgi:hypothetical protein
MTDAVLYVGEEALAAPRSENWMEGEIMDRDTLTRLRHRALRRERERSRRDMVEALAQIEAYAASRLVEPVKLAA